MQQKIHAGSVPVLELDDAGRAAAQRHMQEGDFGRLLMWEPGAQNPEVWWERDRKRARRA